MRCAVLCFCSVSVGSGELGDNSCAKSITLLALWRREPSRGMENLREGVEGWGEGSGDGEAACRDSRGGVDTADVADTDAAGKNGWEATLGRGVIGDYKYK